MKSIKLLNVIIIITIANVSFAQKNINTSEKLIEKMYNTYKGKWYKNYSFYQTTENYRNDSLIKTATWHEALIYPSLFRITIGDSANGNAMITKADTVYHFRKGIQVKKTNNDDDVTFLLGGMYFLPYYNVLINMKREGFDLKKFTTTTYEGNKTYVIGANTSDEKVSQLWIDSKKLVVVKMIKQRPEMKLDVIFSDYKKVGKGWRENKVLIYIDDKLYQKEIYFDCKADSNINLNIFDTNNFINF